MRTDRIPLLPERLLAGVSGGADSVALLQLLIGSGKEVTAVHVNHGLRGTCSDGDEQFVRELCARLSVPLMVYRAESPEHPGEDWARQVRYGFFQEAARHTGIYAIALAHHRDDQAETLLLHLLRGSGLTGLTGMAADVTHGELRILRPLLEYSRQELREMLMAAGQDWREDASNNDSRYLRNALRNDVIPRLEALVPGVSARLACTATLLQGDEAVLNERTEDFLLQHGSGCALPLVALRQQPEAMQRRIVRAWWARLTGSGQEEKSLSAAQTEALTVLIGAPASARCNLPGGWHGQAGWTHLHLVGPERHEAMQPTPVAECSLVRIIPYMGEIGDGKASQAFPQSLLPELTVRTRRTGDWIRPFGSSGRQSLQDYFVNRRIDAPFRDRAPLICRGSEVLLAGGVGAGNVPRMDDTQADEFVLVCWNTAFAWHGR